MVFAESALQKWWDVLNDNQRAVMKEAAEKRDWIDGQYKC